MDYYFGLPKAVLYISGLGVLCDATEIPVVKEFSMFLQYGAFGLCAMMAYGTWKILEQHRAERKELVESLKEKELENKQLAMASLQALNAISEALKDRKCVAGDKRIKVNE